jgi:hypothetical protein
MAAWGDCAGWWHHLDDMLALALASAAAYLIARHQAWWLAAALLGTAAATKPWAIIFVPIIFGVPRVRRSQAALVLVVTAGLWWLPFIIGGPGTVSSLAHFPVQMRPGAVFWPLGVHGFVQGWLRPVQFAGGIAAGALIARRGERAWLAAPLAALAVRVITDPYSFSYYGLGPVLFAILWDLTRPGSRRRPTFASATLFVEYGMLWLAHRSWSGPGWLWADLTSYAKLCWGIGVLTALVLATRPVPETAPLAGVGRPESLPGQSVVASTPSSISSVASRLGVSS